MIFGVPPAGGAEMGGEFRKDVNNKQGILTNFYGVMPAAHKFWQDR
jgi:hypothetical protein